MVLYICNKCNKNFTRKQCYQAHINRKYSCILTENFNTNLELEENNKQYEENNKELTEKNKLYEDKIKQLEDRINNLENDKKLYKENNKQLEDRINNLESVNKTLNNLLDKFIKTNNKNTKDNNDDIKIKMTEGYVYIIRECDFVRLNENIYKIGRTAKINPEDRFQKYRKGTEIIGFFKVNDSIECENKIIKCFSNHNNIKKMGEYGKEYFQGNKKELLNEMLQIVTNYNT
jgi:hypothetical protein